ncbi:MAG: dephospho-CoA kinase [Deltaproteobacteria bacterium]|jgi:dephospho-CoA kinase|nr:dephospho-CoA kinase [Deltaproteobacteria bacterium]
MILGVTGGIASGKSTVANRFAELGAAVVSADQLAREAVRPGTETLAALVKAFGEAILTEDGTLDRKEVAALIFRDGEARHTLEAIVHPEIALLALERMAMLQEGGVSLIIYEAPLLFETGADQRVDQTLMVLVEPDVQIQRIMLRDRLNLESAKARIAAQWPQMDKVVRADYVIDNSGPLPQTRHAVDCLFKYLVG